MTVMLLAIIGFMASGFYVFVLIQWVRHTKRARTIASMAEDRATKVRQQARAGVVGFRKDAVRSHPSARPPLVPSTSEGHSSGMLTKRLQDRLLMEETQR